jgi:hypothetical protein
MDHMVRTNVAYGQGEMRRGKLRIVQSTTFALALQLLRDGPVEISIERRRATRSQEANRYYWGVLVASVAEWTGYAATEVHEIFKAKFLPKPLAVANRHGEIVGEYVLGGSTARLSLPEFSDYCRDIERWATDDLGIAIPEG